MPLEGTSHRMLETNIFFKKEKKITFSSLISSGNKEPFYSAVGSFHGLGPKPEKGSPSWGLQSKNSELVFSEKKRKKRMQPLQLNVWILPIN